MNLLHTSDWHLGRTLYGRKRYAEFDAFLSWLVMTIQHQETDLLIVAGDVFDTSTPSNKAQELYYQFLCQVAMSGCRHVIIVGGNHDSPSFLEAPKSVLHALNVHVVGAISDSPTDEIIVLRHKDQIDAIVCAVPYLRDKDLRQVEPGETLQDKSAKLIAGIKHHYHTVCATAQALREQLQVECNQFIPLIGTGHLFAAGGETEQDDGVRDLYVGSLGQVGADVFPEVLDYVALGHLHVPQTVAGKETIRYSGSPLPMGFGEAKQKKIIIKATFQHKALSITPIEVPVFQSLLRLVGTVDDILADIESLIAINSTAWLEIEISQCGSVVNLREQLDNAVAGSAMEIRRIKNQRLAQSVMDSSKDEQALADIDVNDVFCRCLDAHEVPACEREELLATYAEVLQTLQEDDALAE